MATADLEDLWRKVRVSIAAIMIQLEVPQLEHNFKLRLRHCVVAVTVVGSASVE
jgi:hypothetical protein